MGCSIHSAHGPVQPAGGGPSVHTDPGNTWCRFMLPPLSLCRWLSPVQTGCWALSVIWTCFASDLQVQRLPRVSPRTQELPVAGSVCTGRLCAKLPRGILDHMSSTRLLPRSQQGYLQAQFPSGHLMPCCRCACWGVASIPPHPRVLFGGIITFAPGGPGGRF